MNQIAPAIFPLLILAVVIIGGIYSYMAAQKRREGLFELATRLNLNFAPGKDRLLPERFFFLKQFTEGDDRYATNVISGNYQQGEILAFDYHYGTGSGKSRQEHNLSFFILILRGVAFPQLTIRRDGFLDRVAETFGFPDIKFESAEFSKAFCVRSPDKKFAYDVCNPAMMEYLLANRDLTIEVDVYAIALVFNTRLAVELFEPNLQRLVEIRTRLPQYLFTAA